MNSLFTFALGAVSALVLVPMFAKGKRHRHRHHGGMHRIVSGKKGR